MGGEYERVFLIRHPDQATADERAPLEVERGARLLGHQAGPLRLTVGMPAQVVIDKVIAAVRRRRDTLYGLLIDGVERCAQDLMASNDPVQSPAQDRPVEAARQVQPAREVECRGAGRSHPFEEPQSSLRER